MLPHRMYTELRVAPLTLSGPHAAPYSILVSRAGQLPAGTIVADDRSEKDRLKLARPVDKLIDRWR